jgi:hypothetical protein
MVIIVFRIWSHNSVYKLRKIHVVTNALSRLLDNTKPTCVPNQSTYASLFYTWLD